MKSVRNSLLIAMMLVASQGFAAKKPTPMKWEVDVDHSSVNFSVRHLVVSKVRGKFAKFSGDIVADELGLLKSVKGDLFVQSIDTGITKRDDHLRSPDFFDAAKFPKIHFESTAITVEGTQAVVEGKLTIKDVTKQVRFAGEFFGKTTANFGTGDYDHLGYSFSGTINRKDFGVNFAALMNGRAVVGDEVDLNLELEATRKL